MTDILLHNAHILTMEPDQPDAHSLLIRDDRIHTVGSNADHVVAEGAVRLDAHGCTVLPGFIDPHNHLLSTAESLVSVDARYPVVRDTDELVHVIAVEASGTPTGQWIRAFGMDDAKYPHGRPTRQQLDAATDEHPVIVYHVSGHQAVVNSLALAERNIRNDVADPEGGQFVRDEAGRLTGMVTDSAMQHLLPVAVDIGCHGPNFHTDLPAEHLLGWLADAAPHYLAAGLTTIADPQVSARELQTYRTARAHGCLPVRTVAMPLSHQLDALASLGLAGPFGDDWLNLGPMKFYADGTLLGGTALFDHPYGEHSEFTGSMYWTPDQLVGLVERAGSHGWQVAIHTQGDRAMGFALDAIDAAVKAFPGHDARPRIEHCGLPTPEHVRRFTDLGVIPVNQPNFLHDSGNDFLRRLGTRAHRLQPMREEIEAGLRPVLSSDSFVSSFRPMHTVANAVRRRTREDQPIGTAQSVTLHQALKAHTLDAAHALRMEDRIGSLRTGKLADIVILDRNIETTHPDELDTATVAATILNGQIKHRQHITG